MQNIVDAPIEQVMQIRAQLLPAMSDIPEHEEIVRLDTVYLTQREVFLNLLEGEESGDYDEDSVDTSIVQAVDDAATNQLAIFDMEMEVEIGDDDGDMFGDDAQMSANRGSQYASFSLAHGEVMAGLIEQQYEDSNDGIADIATVAGATESDVIGAIRGEVAFEPAVNIAIADIFDSLKSNPQAHREFVQLGTQAYNELIQQSQPQTAQMSAPTVDYELRAEFARQENKKAREQDLKDFMRRADADFDAGIITPHEHYELVGGLIEDRSDRIAAFSQVCETQRVDPDLFLYANARILDFLERRGPVIQFSELSDSTPLEAMAPEDLKYAQEFHSRNGYE